MGGKEMLLRHINLLPEVERKAVLLLMEGGPKTPAAVRGARMLVAKNIIPALGFEELD